MKKLLLLLFVASAQAQAIDSIRNTPTEFLPVVVELPNTPKEAIYTKVKAYINRTYKNPEIVTKADEKDKYIRINGSDTYSFTYMGNNNYPLEYNLEIEIKDNKYRVKFINVEDRTLHTPYMPETFYDKNGKLKTMKVKGRMLDGVLKTLNKIHFNLYIFVKGKDGEW